MMMCLYSIITQKSFIRCQIFHGRYKRKSWNILCIMNTFKRRDEKCIKNYSLEIRIRMRNIMYQRCNRKKLHLLVKLESMMSDIIGKRIYFFKQFSSLFVVMNPMEFPGEIISTRNEISLIVLKNGINEKKLKTN